MIPREFISIAAGNLWRQKLRAGLTISGVVIGIGALVAMLSFAFGVQKRMGEQFRDLGLFHTIHVLPGGSDALDRIRDSGDSSDPDEDPDRAVRPKTRASVRDSLKAAWDSGAAADSDSVAERPDSAAQVPPEAETDGPPPRILDLEAIEMIAQFDGVELVYPQDTFDAQVIWNGEEYSLTAQALPASFSEKRQYGTMTSGRFFCADSAREAVLSARILERWEVSPDSIVGDTIQIRTAGRAALIRLMLNEGLRSFGVPDELQDLAQRMSDLFLTGFGGNELEVVVTGVAELESGFGFRVYNLLLPSGTAGQLDRVGFSDPIELMSRMQAGPTEGYSLAVVTASPSADLEEIREKIEALGLNTFDFMESFAEMRKAFLIFDLFVSILAFIAIVVAALGIVNTMVMSILERTREIGILKSLGAQNGQVRLLFLLESALIGLIGSLGGLLLGWIISRIASFAAKRLMESQGGPVLEMFHVPWPLIVGAILFGLLVSLAAGLYPAARAARIDPVKALRQE